MADVKPTLISRLIAQVETYSNIAHWSEQIMNGSDAARVMKETDLGDFNFKFQLFMDQMSEAEKSQFNNLADEDSGGLMAGEASTGNQKRDAVFMAWCIHPTIAPRLRAVKFNMEVEAARQERRAQSLARQGQVDNGSSSGDSKTLQIAGASPALVKHIQGALEGLLKTVNESQKKIIQRLGDIEASQKSNEDLHEEDKQMLDRLRGLDIEKLRRKFGF
jgi:hypothetical protein